MRDDAVRSRSLAILIVDDDLLMAAAMHRLLQPHFSTVLVAHSGYAALQVLAERPGEIQLVLSDVQMPDVEGPELAAQLSVLHPQVSVVLMTGGSKTIMTTCRVLAKPCSVAEVIAAFS